MKRLVIFGTSHSVIMVYHQIVEDGKYQVVGFTIDKEFITEEVLFDLPVIPFEQIEMTFNKDKHALFIPIGFHDMNKTREHKYIQAKKYGYAFVSHIHPTAILYPDVTIGENCLVGPYTVIQPNTKIGNNVIIRENCHIGHSSKINDHCFIAGHSNICGNVTIESNCFLGASCVIKDSIVLKRSSLIGAGVTMLEDSGENEAYINKSTQKLPFGSTNFI